MMLLELGKVCIADTVEDLVYTEYSVACSECQGFLKSIYACNMSVKMTCIVRLNFSFLKKNFNSRQPSALIREYSQVPFLCGSIDTIDDNPLWVYDHT